MVNLRHRNASLHERMDDPNADPERLRRTYARFVLINRLFAGWRRTYATRIHPFAAARGGRSIRILDVGCGGGDITRALERWARRDGLAVEVTGVDPDPVAIAEARTSARREGSTVRFVQGLAGVLGTTYDIVVSNHVMHHIDDLPGFLDETTGCCVPGGLVLHSDIERSHFAYVSFSVLSLPLTPGTFIREDGLLSIRRSYNAPELQITLPEPWHVTRQAPCRLLVHSVMPDA